MRARMGARTIAESFNPRSNSLNFLRLTLALTVILSHSLTLGGTRQGGPAAEDILNSTPGQIAVFGFFGISGFLIARSADHNGFARYLWQRFLRIFPGYWMCLLLTGLVFGVIAWVHGQSHCGLSCYFKSSTGPFPYVYHNFLLRQNQPDIAGTPTNVPLPGVWNGSLWTLQYEFACYVLVGVMAVFGLLRRRVLVVLFTAAVWVAADYIVFTQTSLAPPEGFDEVRLLGLVPLFFVGALLYLYRDRIPDSGWLAAGSAVIFVGSLWLPFGTGVTFSFFPTLNAAVVSSVFFAYPLIWLGIHLPLQRVGARNDYSYGAYVYAWPIQQLLATWNVERWGMPIFMVFSVGCTMPFAIASWWLIEKHALRLKKLGRRSAAEPKTTKTKPPGSREGQRGLTSRS